jgi:hypothetical protein
VPAGSMWWNNAGAVALGNHARMFCRNFSVHPRMHIWRQPGTWANTRQDRSQHVFSGHFPYSIFHSVRVQLYTCNA